MDYKKHYNQLINSRKALNRNKKDGNYYEKHHIIPKCLGGSNKKDNIILLTPREHFIAHLLLTEMYEGKIKSKMCYAFLLMCAKAPLAKRIITSKQFDLARKKMSENYIGENNPYFGKKHSKESKIKMTKHLIGNTFRLGMAAPNKGKKMSEEQKKKLQGIKRSEETKLKLSISKKGKGAKKILCIENGIIYNSITEASILLNIHAPNIIIVLKGRGKSIKGYTFKYVN